MERVPWAAGYRIGLADKDMLGTWNGNLSRILDLLTELEMRALSDADAAEFERWVYTGLMCAQVERAVREARGL